MTNEPQRTSAGRLHSSSSSVSETREDLTAVYLIFSFEHISSIIYTLISSLRRKYHQFNNMGKRILFTWALTTLLLLLSSKHSSGSFLSSLQFTRDAFMDFSRGSQRTVGINLASKITTKTVNKTYKLTDTSKVRLSSSFKLEEVKGINNGTNEPVAVVRTRFSDLIRMVRPEDLEDLFSMRKHLPKQVLLTAQINNKGELETLLLVPFNKTVVENQTKHEVYRTRASPSNKFMKAIDEIELAQTNANALDVKYSSAALAKLKVLVERAIRSKSYKYARQVT